MKGEGKREEKNERGKCGVVIEYSNKDEGLYVRNQKCMSIRD